MEPVRSAQGRPGAWDPALPTEGVNGEPRAVGARARPALPTKGVSDQPPAPGDDRAEIVLHGVAHGGEAVGRLGDQVAFVSLGLPGERVRVEIAERKHRFIRGRVREVLKAAPERVLPPCPIFGTCGGCHWQHAAYEAQLAFKTAVLQDLLTRIGRFPNPPLVPAIASPKEWHYRNTVQFVPATGPGSARMLCFRRGRSHEPVPVEHCDISDDLINRAIREPPWAQLSDQVWAWLDSIVVRAVPQTALQITLVGQERVPLARLEAEVSDFAAAARTRLPELAGVLVAPARGGRARVVFGEPALPFDIGGHRLEIPAGVFVQVNLGIAERLVERVLDWLAPGPRDTVVDAYAGAGTFTLPLARRAASVLAIEFQAAAAASGRRNAAAHGLENVRFEAAPVERVVQSLAQRVDLVVLDPPRRGCDPAVIAGLARLRPRRVVYVSCEPSTLARDLRAFARAGFRLTRAGVADMFPQTFHLEAVALLER